MKKRIKRTLNNFNAAALFQDFIRTAAVYLVATCLALCLNGAEVLNENIFGVYMLAVALISYMTSGYFWGVIASIGGVIGVNFFFTFPYFALNFSITGYPITFSIMLLMSILTSFVTAKVKMAALLSAAGKKRAETLTEMSKAILSASDVDTIIDISAKYFSETNQCSVILYVDQPLKPLKQSICTLRDEDERILHSFLEKQVAQRAYDTQNPVGAEIENGTQNCKGTYFPIITEDKIYGVVGFLFDETKLLIGDTFSFINVMISQTILALQRQQARKKAQEILLETEKEKMRSNLLRAVSHDLRTPLTGIIGAATTLLENGTQIASEDSRKMLMDIQHDAEWLIHMVENLLSVTRIENGTMKIEKEPEIVEEVILEAVKHIDRRKNEHHIHIRIDDDMMMADMDAKLMIQVIINLVDNAIKYTPGGGTVSLDATWDDARVTLIVKDTGIGIAKEDLPYVFDRFYKVDKAHSGMGSGLGLSIARELLKWMGEDIWVKSEVGKGSQFGFTLRRDPTP